MLKRTVQGVAWFTAALLLSSLAFSAETGTVKVQVLDTEELPLPGVTVTATSPSFMGTKIEVSNAGGVARLSRLTPGVYTIEAALAGFGTKRAEKVRVSLEATTTIEMTLQAATGETVEVTSAHPQLDTTSNTIRDHINLEDVESLPVGRDYVAYMQLVAGVNMVPNAQGIDTPSDPAGKGGLNYSDRGGDTGLT